MFADSISAVAFASLPPKRLEWHDKSVLTMREITSYALADAALAGGRALGRDSPSGTTCRLAQAGIETGDNASPEGSRNYRQFFHGAIDVDCSAPRQHRSGWFPNRIKMLHWAHSSSWW